MKPILVALFLAFLASPANAVTTTASPVTCASTACVAGTDVAWVNPTRAMTSNGQWATAAVSSSATLSECLYCTFGGNLSAVPTGATISGVTVNVERSVGPNVTIYDEYIQIVSDDAALAGDNKAAASTAWPTSDGTATYGGASDTWGLAGVCSTLAADCADTSHTNIKDSDFGVVIVAEYQSGAGNTAYVDHVQISIEHTGGATETPTPGPTNTPTATPTVTPTNTPTVPAGLTCVSIPFQTYGELAFASSEAGWSSEASAATCDGATSYSQGNITSTSGYSNLLRASNLDLTGIPTDKTWYGFTVTVQASITTAANYDDYVVQWIDGSSTLAGENKARSLPFTISPTYETRTYGAQYDKWGNEFCITTANAACPNPAHINLNDSDVGIGLSVERLSSTTTAVRVSCITIEGCYLDNTPTPTITPTPGATDTPANTPTPTPTLDPPAAGCCRSEIYTVP